MLSVIITAHNEGPELRQTVKSVAARTGGHFEILVVDDGSTDSGCTGIESPHVRLLRNTVRCGVAPSRHMAVQQAQGDALAFVDGHQRVTTNALNRCAATAKRFSAIITPDIRGFEAQEVTSHGATFERCPQHGYFSARWQSAPPPKMLSRVSSLKAPAYVIPRSIYDQVRWIEGLRNWGGSEAAVSLKAFFLSIPILHLCGTPTWHRFKPQLHYDATWDDVWRNHALIARVCFDDRSWFRYWLPKVFGDHLTEQAHADLESTAITNQHEEFARHKVRADEEFWTSLLQQSVPAELQ